MVLRDYRNIARVSYILIVIALVLFALSVELIYSDSPMKWPASPESHFQVGAGSNTSLHYNASISKGDDLFYTASSNQTFANVSIYLLEPTGPKIPLKNITGTTQVSGQIVLPQPGNATFLLVNNGNRSAYVNLTADRISYLTVYTLVFAFASMASGIVLLIAASRVKRGEGRLSERQRRMD